MRIALTALLLVLVATRLSAAEEGEFSHVKPITNPVYSETAIPQSRVTIIHLMQSLPDQVELITGAQIPLDGNLNVTAVQIEYAFSNELSLVANKDGWLNFRPENVLSHEQGLGDLALGLKWAFYHEDGTTLALRGMVELPSGDDDVWQGNGDGNVTPALLATWQSDMIQLNGVAGAILPFDTCEESTLSYVSISAAWNATPAIHPLIEFNWFHVLSPGDGRAEFDDRQGGGLLPTVLPFEGGDLLNLGTSNSNMERDYMTAAIGVRLDVTDSASLGLAYEIPVTPTQFGLLESRININLNINF